MPSTSKKQHRLMAAVAHNPSFAKKVGIPSSVGRDFAEADKGRKFAKGGDMKESKEMMKKEVAFMKKKGAPKSMIKHEEKEAKGYAKGGFTSAADGVAKHGKTKAQRFAMGGMPTVGMAGPQKMTPAAPAPTAPSRPTPTPNVSGMAQPSAQQLMAARAGKTPAAYAMGSASKLLEGSQKPVSSARPTNPFTNPKQYKAEQAAQYSSAISPEKQAKLGAAVGKMFGGVPKEGRRGDSGYSVPGKLGLQYGPRITTEQQKKLGESLGKMFSGARPKEGKAVTSRDDTGFKTPKMMDDNSVGAKKGGSVKTFAKGGSVDGCATKGKTKCRYI